MKAGDEVWYTITGDEPRKWTITSTFDTHTEGFVACLSRPDDTKKLGIDRCNAMLVDLEKVGDEESDPSTTDSADTGSKR